MLHGQAILMVNKPGVIRMAISSSARFISLYPVNEWLRPVREKFNSDAKYCTSQAQVFFTNGALNHCGQTAAKGPCADYFTHTLRLLKHHSGL